MKLYHGTSAVVADKALKEGLKPRGKSKGRWAHSVMSNPEAVYLTDAYPAYYAMNAVQPGEDFAVLEIDTDKLLPWLLAPDEDVLAQLHSANKQPHPDLPKGFHGWSLNKQTKWFSKRVGDYAGGDQWRASLKAMGTCCYLGTIPASAIKRVAYVGKDAGNVRWMALDPTISLMNYKLVGSKYRALTKWLFNEGAGDDMTDYFGSPVVLPPETDREHIRLEVNKSEAMT